MTEKQLDDILRMMSDYIDANGGLEAIKGAMENFGIPKEAIDNITDVVDKEQKRLNNKDAENLLDK